MAHTGLWFSGWSGHWGKGSWLWLLCAEKAGSYLKAGLAQGYLVLNVVSTGAHSNPGRVWSNTAKKQGVRLEHTVFGTVIGWEHQVTVRMLYCLAINAIAVGGKKEKLSLANMSMSFLQHKNQSQWVSNENVRVSYDSCEVQAYFARLWALLRWGKKAGSQISPCFWQAVLQEEVRSALTTWSVLSGGQLVVLEQKSWEEKKGTCRRTLLLTQLRVGCCPCQ